MTDWRPEHDNAVRRHFLAGLSCAAAADKLNEEFGTSFTRSAVIGRTNRMGIARSTTRSAVRHVKPGPPAAPQPAKRPQQRPDIAARKAADAPKPIAPAPFVPRQVEANPQNVPLLELVPNGCRWPQGNGPFLFCNQDQATGSSYCAQHHQLATNHHHLSGREKPDADTFRMALRRIRNPSCINLTRDFQAGQVGGDA